MICRTSRKSVKRYVDLRFNTTVSIRRKGINTIIRSTHKVISAFIMSIAVTLKYSTRMRAREHDHVSPHVSPVQSHPVKLSKSKNRNG